jgi:hypothetical protein
VSDSSTRTAAARASVSANLSGQNNPNKKQRPEIALERGDQPEGGFGVRQAVDQDAALASRKRDETLIAPLFVELRAFFVWAESNSPQEDSQKGGVERVFGV